MIYGRCDACKEYAFVEKWETDEPHRFRAYTLLCSACAADRLRAAAERAGDGKESHPVRWWLG